MKRLRDLSLAVKVFAGVAVLIVAIVAFQFLFFARKQSVHFIEALREKALSESLIMSHMASAGLEFDDPGAVKLVLEGGFKDKDLRYAAMHKQDGAVMVSKVRGKHRPRIGQISPARTSVSIDDDAITVTMPVKTKTGKRGALVTSYSMATAHEKSRATLKAMLIAALIVLGISSLVALGLGKRVKRRLEILARMAEQVAEGDLSTPEITDHSRDEVGRMSESLALMINNLRKLRDQARRIAEGDLSTQVDVPGELAVAFNVMTESQRKMVLNLTGTGSVLARAARSLLETSEDIAREADATQQQSGHVDATGQEMSSTIQELATSAEGSAKTSIDVANSTKTMSTRVSSIAASIEQMSSGLQEVSRSCNRAVERSRESNDKAKEASRKVQELGKAAKIVGQIVDVISQVADQTKLLALNATIEAASAGEAGRGFAVVANEVKELAKQTTQATGDIIEHVEGIQTITTSTVEVITNVSELMDEITNAFNIIAVSIEEQSGVVQEISSNIADGAQAAVKTSNGVDDISKRIRDIADFAAHLAQRSSEVTTSISTVRQAAVSTASGTEDVRKAAAEMSDLADQLTEAVAQFTLERATGQQRPGAFAGRQAVQ